MSIHLLPLFRTSLGYQPCKSHKGPKAYSLVSLALWLCFLLNPSDSACQGVTVAATNISAVFYDPPLSDSESGWLVKPFGNNTEVSSMARSRGLVSFQFQGELLQCIYYHNEAADAIYELRRTGSSISLLADQSNFSTSYLYVSIDYQPIQVAQSSLNKSVDEDGLFTFFSWANITGPDLHTVIINSAFQGEETKGTWNLVSIKLAYSTRFIAILLHLLF